MDNVRLFLWAGLGLLLWLTLQAWQRDYATVPSATPTAATATQRVPAQATPADLPDLPDALPAKSDDVDALPTTVAVNPSSQMIEVRTDVLDLRIDLTGGDIRGASLPLYPRAKDRPDDPVVLLSENPADLKIFRTGLRNAAGGAEATHLAKFSAARKSFELGDGQDELVVPLRWEQDGVTVEKIYRFIRGRYEINMEQRLTNQSAETYAAVPYVQIQALYSPPERSMFDVDTYSFNGPVVYDGEAYEKLDVEDLAEEPFQQTISNGWLAAIEHHFLAAAVPGGQGASQYTANFDGSNFVASAIAAELTQIAPGSQATFNTKLFVGPKLQEQLEETAEGLKLTVDYGALTLLAQPLFWILDKVYGLVGNWGWTIIMVTFLIKLVFYKLTETSGRSMAKMRKLQPRLKALQERYKDDREAMSKNLMEMYKKEKVNPAAGCLPMLVQIPFFIAFYWVLLESVEMRQAPFMLWITDLSVRDPLFILPLLMGGAMWFQQKLNPAPPDPIQAKVMMFLPIMFTGMFAFFPAGLVLYWLTNSVLSMLQQWKINRVVEAQG